MSSKINLFKLFSQKNKKNKRMKGNKGSLWILWNTIKRKWNSSLESQKEKIGR